MQTLQSRTLLVADILAVAGLTMPSTGLLHLFTSPAINGPGLVLADFTEATFTGYTSTGIGASVLPGMDVLGNGVAKQGVSSVFECTGTAVPNTVFGWYITDSAGTTLLEYGFFDGPLTFAVPGDTLVMHTRIQAQLFCDADTEYLSGP